ncbi:MAG: ATP-binding protein [Candidatus Bathyarchaeota archaeon]|jgi:lon-related putative ATP-dependent protease
MLSELQPEKASKRYPEELLDFNYTEELEPLEGIIGQDRAVEALKFGLKIQEKGFNIYLAGPSGTGKRTAVLNFLEEIAEQRNPPSDWCYVNNFKDPLKPNALRLPPGIGRKFQKDMEDFSTEIKTALKQAFESDEYNERQERALKSVQSEQNKLTEELNKKAEEAGFVMKRSPVGILLIPVINGQPVADPSVVPPEKREEIRRKRKELQEEIRDIMREVRSLGKEAKSSVKKLNRNVASYALEALFEELIEAYGDIEEVKGYLDDVREDILDNLDAIRGKSQKQMAQLPPQLKQMAGEPTDRYKVNLIVDNSGLDEAPVVKEMNPTYINLFGKMETEVKFGATTTDYTMIRSGSAHEANGGFLVIPVERLLRNPFAWDSLKRSIMNEELDIEKVTERLGFLTTKSLQPESIPFDAKVVLLGEPSIYYLLYKLDTDFKEIFKVKAEFDTEMERNEENIGRYASFICTVCEKESLTHLDPSGVASVLEYSSRLAADKEKLSTRFAEISDIIREASFYAQEEGADFADKDHVEKALEKKVYRSSLIKDKIQEMIARGTLLIETEDEEVGQVNGLSIVDLGDSRFGRPTRVTAAVGVGRDGIIDIEREAELGGPIHTKGVQILSGYLHSSYALDNPLSLNARLVFEQTYSGVEGDSASSTELYTILSALSGRPIKQYVAVTGSVNQKGIVQSIGGVNEKIEGYYEICKEQGLNGKQGVVIPESNVKNLMLKGELVKAIEDGRFHIYPVKTISEGIEVLTGKEAGERQPDGSYPEGTLNHTIQMQLTEMAEKIKEYKE